VEIFENGDLDAADELLHPDFVNHEAGPSTPPGAEGLKQTVRWLRDAFSNLRFEIHDELAEGDKVTSRLTMSGRHSGNFMGFEPTGKEFNVQHIHMWRIADDRVIEHWANRDDLGLLMQLGLLPGPPAS